MTIKGIAFPFNKDDKSFPAQTEDDITIEDNIRRIILTRRGERVMRPNTGSDVMGFVFENTGPMLNAKINYEVRRAIAAGEPRVQVLQVQVGRKQNQITKGIELHVAVAYRLHGDIQQTVVKL